MLPSRPLARGLGLLASRPTIAPATAVPAAAAAAHQTSTALTAARAFTSISPAAYKQVQLPKKQIPIPSPTANQPEIPPYPYGERPFYKQANKGLYGSAAIRFGNNVSDKYEVKTRRKWRPNVHSRRLWSESLGAMVRTRITTRVLRTLDKCGGLDNYLLGSKAQRIKDLGPWGWRLRWRIMQTPRVRAMFRAQRIALGLPPDGVAAAAAEGCQALPEGYTAESLMQEMDEMLQKDLEFDLDGADGEAETATGDDGFMREEPKPGPADARP